MVTPSERILRGQRRVRRATQFNTSMLFDIHLGLDTLFNRFMPPIDQSLPFREILEEQERLFYGTRTLDFPTVREGVSISSKREDTLQGVTTDVRRLRIPGQSQTIVLGFGYGRTESDTLEQAPKYPPIISQGRLLDYLPEPAKVASLTTRQILDVKGLIGEIVRLPDSQIIYTATPRKRS